MTGPPALSRIGYDRAVHRRTDQAWLDAAWARSQVLVVAPDGTVAIRTAGDQVGLALQEPATVSPELARVFLGEKDGTPYFAALDLTDLTEAKDAPQPDTLPPGQSRAGLRTVGAVLDDVGSGLLTSAIALRNYHLRHPYCPRCGTLTRIIMGGWARRCPKDGSDHFPRTDPAVIMLVHDGADRCVLGRQAVWPKGRYSILAGFVDPGEPAEAAVAREVAEEVGLAVTDVRYVFSQPWPFPGSLMLGFTARVEGDPTLRPVDDELEDAQWFSREQIRSRDGVDLLPSPVSIAYRLLSDWLDSSDAKPSGE